MSPINRPGAAHEERCAGLIGPEVYDRLRMRSLFLYTHNIFIQGVCDEPDCGFCIYIEPALRFYMLCFRCRSDRREGKSDRCGKSIGVTSQLKETMKTKQIKQQNEGLQALPDEQSIQNNNRRGKNGDMAILDAHPEIKTIGFRASAIAGPGSGGYFDFQITDAGFAHIANVRNLETLILDPRMSLKLSDNALQSLVGLKIKNLHLGATKFTAQGLAVLSKLEALTDFSAEASAAGDVCAAAGKFPHLRVLTVTPYEWDGSSLVVYRRNYPSDKDIEQLAALSELEELYLDDVEGVSLRREATEASVTLFGHPGLTRTEHYTGRVGRRVARS